MYQRTIVVLVFFLTSVVNAHAGDLRPKKLLLLTQGPDGHAASTHEYDAGARILAVLLARVPGLSIETMRADGAWADGPEKLSNADGAFLFLAQGAKWIYDNPRIHDGFSQLAARQGGLSALHWAIGTKESPPIESFIRLFGGCHGGPDRRFQELETQLTPVDPAHPITRGVASFRVRDEFYYRLKMPSTPQRSTSILTAEIDGQSESVAWAFERAGGGRSFGFSGCHFHNSWKHPEYRRFIAQGVLWTMNIEIPAAGLPVDVPIETLRLP